MITTAVKVNNRKDFETLVTLMVANGYTYSPYNTHTTPKEVADSWARSYSYLLLSDKKNLNGCNHGCSLAQAYLNWPEDAATVVDMLFNSKKNRIVENVGDYTAEITENGIEVGCQTIPFEKFQEIVEAVKAVKEVNQ